MADQPDILSAEEWRDVAGFEDAYEVSSHGNVRSKVRDVQFRNRWGKSVTHRRGGHLLKFRYDRGGYRRVCLYREGEPNHIFVHRLVCAAFVGPQPTKGHEVNHKDCVRTNNRADNLEWVTRQINALHRARVGKSSSGENNPNVKLSRAKVQEIRVLIEAGFSGYDIAKSFGVSQSMVSCIKTFKNWQ